MKGDRVAVQSLLAQKEDVNAAQADGATAIQWAVYRDDPEMADVLIARGRERQTGQSRRRYAALFGVTAWKRADD